MLIGTSRPVPAAPVAQEHAARHEGEGGNQPDQALVKEPCRRDAQAARNQQHGLGAAQRHADSGQDNARTSTGFLVHDFHL